MSEFEHLPHAPHDRTYWNLQGVVEMPDGVSRRYSRNTSNPSEVPSRDGALSFIMHGKTEGVRLVKAWLETITVSSTSAVREFNLTQP